MRPHVCAVYAFARIADDIADEGHDAAAIRQGRLRAWQHRLHEAAEGTRIEQPAGRDDLVFVALGHSIRTLSLPVSLFDDLLSAFGQDITTVRYPSWHDVLDYCRRSANPVGRLVLRIAGYDAATLDRSSDALCTALQLTNFWQDFGRDWRAGRLYVPLDLVEAYGAREAELASGAMSSAWVRVLQACVDVTRARFDEGREVCDGVSGRLRFELRLTWLGGRRVLDHVERSCTELLQARPTLATRDVPPLLWNALRWRGVST
jgi:phytoene synthase